MKLSLNITTKLTLLFVLFAVLLLIGVGVLAYYNGRAALEAATISDLLSTAIEKEAALNAWVEDRQFDITALANSPDLGEDVAALIAAVSTSAEAQAAHDRLVRQLRAWVGSGQQYQTLMFIEAETGRVIAATDPDEEGKFKGDRPFFINGQNGPYVQNLYYSITLQDLSMTAAAPLRSADGQLLGVLAGRLNLAPMNTIINRRTGVHQSDDFFLVNTSKLVVTQPRFITEPAVLRREVNTEAVKRCLAPSSGVVSTEDYRGVPTIIIYRWLPKHQLCLIVKIDQTEVLAPARAFGQTLWLIGSLVLLAASVLAVGLARTITRPVLALQSGATRLGQGELEVRLPETSGDELGRLARQFNQMAAALSEKEAQLRHYTEELEQLVQERTTFLHESQAQLQAILDYSPALISTKDLNGNITLINKRFEEVIAPSREVFVGKNIYDLFPYEIADALWQNDLAAQSGPIEAEETLAHKDGTVHTYLTVKFPLRYPDTGQVFGTCAISTDITDRKQAEEQFRLVVEASPNAIILTSTEGKIHLVNAWAEVLFGYTREELLGQPIEMLVPPPLRDRHRHDRDMFFTAPQARPMGAGRDLFGWRKDGSLVPLEIGLTPITTSEGDFVLATVVDITARRQAEKAIRLKDELLRMTGEMAQVGGWEFDATTLEGTWTDEVARIHDLDPAQTTNVELGLSFYLPESREKIEKAIQEAVEFANPYDLELEMVSANGTHKWVRTMALPVTDGDKVIKVRGFFQDITERKQVEVEIRRLNEELEQRVVARTAQFEAANQELAAFAYSVSHDLRAPLRGIDGFSQALLEDYADKLDAQGQRFLQRVRAASQRMAQLIDDLLALSRLTRSEMRREPVNLSLLALTIAEELRKSEPERQVEFSIAEGLVSSADARLMRVALENLLHNAWKFTAKQPSAQIEFGLSQSDGKAVYFVRDDGAGFDMAYADKLFGAFQRLHTPAEFAGTGIGLATVQRIIHRHGGQVWAEGAVDQGATFYFTL